MKHFPAIIAILIVITLLISEWQSATNRSDFLSAHKVTQKMIADIKPCVPK